jgi:hypothetical protein
MPSQSDANPPMLGRLSAGTLGKDRAVPQGATGDDGGLQEGDRTLLAAWPETAGRRLVPERYHTFNEGPLLMLWTAPPPARRCQGKGRRWR